MDNLLNISDTTGLRNRLNQSKADKENKSENEFEFKEPSLLSINDSDIENDNCDELDKCANDDTINLIDLNTDLDVKKNQANNENLKRTSNTNTKFGGDRNFKFNFQMPKIIQTKDKVDEASENFLDTVHTPSKRLQAENTNSKHKKVRLDESYYQPNWTLIKATFFVALFFGLLKIALVIWRNDYSFHGPYD